MSVQRVYVCVTSLSTKRDHILCGHSLRFVSSIFVLLSMFRCPLNILMHHHDAIFYMHSVCTPFMTNETFLDLIVNFDVFL